MLTSRACKATTKSGEPCRQPPLHESEFCFWHDPERTEEAAQARKLGGQRRRRESTLQGAYDFEALDSTAGIRRVLEIVTYDGLGMENSVARGRLLISAMTVAASLLKTGEVEDRLAELEAVIKPRIDKGRRAR